MLIPVLLAQMAFGLLAMTITLPSMQEWSTIFGVDQSRVQLTFSGYVITYGALQLIYGPLSDRYGRRRILLTGLVIALAGALLAGFAPNLELLVAARLLQGAGGAAGIVAGRATIQDLFKGPERTRVMAYVGMVMGLVPPAGTIIGGQLHVLLGSQANFFMLAALAAVLLYAAVKILPEHRPAAGADGGAPRGHWLPEMFAAYRRLAKEPAFLLNVSVLATTVAVFYAFLSGAPLVLRSYGVGPDKVGFYIMVAPISYIFGNWATSRLARRAGPQTLMQTGQAFTLTGIGTMLVLAWAGVGHPLAFALPLILLGIGHGLLVPTCLAGTVGLIPALAGAASGVAGVSQQLTGALSGYLVGLLDHDGPVQLGLLMIGFTLCASVSLWVLGRMAKGRAAAA